MSDKLIIFEGKNSVNEASNLLDILNRHDLYNSVKVNKAFYINKRRWI